MTLDEMQELAENAGDEIVLVIPPPLSKGEKIRLCRKSGPLGQILCVNRKGNTVARFSAKSVLAWCLAQRASE